MPGGTTGTGITAVDLFCGAGGLSYGLRRSGIDVVAGVDVDGLAGLAYTANNPDAEFLHWDVTRKNSPSVAKLFPDDEVRLLAGCAPCSPFSKLTNGSEGHQAWGLLDHFGRFVAGCTPEIVTMENVPELARRGRQVFGRFCGTLEGLGYYVSSAVVNCADYGVAQSRFRLVLLASRLGPISIPKGQFRGRPRTVRDTISYLPVLASGEQDSGDALHVAARLTEINLKRIQATPHDGGAWKDWPSDLRLRCHARQTGKSYGSIYGRMWWDKPAPTMTTLCNGIGNGRFGHPVQDRAITLREAALLQSFPKGYDFWPSPERLNRRAIGKMIGNAVPPTMAEALGWQIVQHVADAKRNWRLEP